MLIDTKILANLYYTLIYPFYRCDHLGLYLPDKPPTTCCAAEKGNANYNVFKI